MDNLIIRTELLFRFPQMLVIANKLLISYKENNPSDTLTTVYNIIDRFINDAKQEHNVNTWKDRYIRGCILLTCHFIVEAQNEATNSGLIVRDKTGGADGAETEFMRPSLSNFGEFATSAYGRQWEGMRNNLIKGSFSRRLI